MKKTSKILAVVLATLLVVAAVVVLAACDDPAATTDPVVINGVAYGAVHSGCIGKATVVVTDGKVTAATLDEAELPTSVKPTTEEAETYAEYVVNGYWKTVKWTGVTATYEDGGYKVGEQALKDYLAVPANAKLYFEAVAANEVKVAVSTKAADDKTDIMTAAKLLKSQNGYWQGEKITNPAHLGWKANVDATIAYVVANGFGAFDGKPSTADGTVVDNSAEDAKLDNEVVDKNGVRTGATWSDFILYYNLLKAASDQAATAVGEQVVTGEVKLDSGVRGNNKYSAKVQVTVKDGVITAVELLDIDDGYVWTTDRWQETVPDDGLQEWVNENLVGKDVATIYGWAVNATVSGANTIAGSVPHIANGTETCARIIAAIQNALSKLAA